MSVSALDSRVFRNLFGTQEIRDVFTDEAYVRRMIETEAALARAQSKVGIIPAEAGEELTKALEAAKIDFEKLSRDTDIVGYPVLPLVEQLVHLTPENVSKYIHWGATTQDIMDDASVLQIKAALQIVKRYLHELVGILRRLAAEHRDTPTAGRTHLQHALPCTFGYKCAVYLSGIERHLTRLQEIEKRCLYVQFGGASGTLASLGSDDKGLQTRAQLAEELGLANPPITWHVVRDNIAEVLNFLALVGGSLGKVALDVIVMSSNEFGEVSEPFVPLRGASSTMPQKRNPISSEVVLAASKLLRAHAGLGLDAMVVDFERASGPWHLEWVAIPEAFVLCVGSLHQTCFALGGLVVNTGAMMENLCSTRGLIVGEAVMMGLAPFIGRQNAHDAVYSCCKESIETKVPLLDVLLSRKEITDKMDSDRLAALCNPTNYFGASQLMVDDMLKASKNGINGH
ncbi:3-carboxy-cis,cis-muconate cycloisomerase [Diaporthe sp. PMI_573]|nr:3-carboxy-cis,cis-muconate cycloisomerase [Diaporthaceae sp. PMI_573]